MELCARGPVVNTVPCQAVKIVFYPFPLPLPQLHRARSSQPLPPPTCRDGRRLGEAEGKALGAQKGFEMGHEVGYYAGCVQVRKPNEGALLLLAQLSA